MEKSRKGICVGNDDPNKGQGENDVLPIFKEEYLLWLSIYHLNSFISYYLQRYIDRCHFNVIDEKDFGLKYHARGLSKDYFQTMESKQISL